MLHWKRRLMWNISKKLTYTPYFFRRNRDLGTISDMGGTVTSAVVYPPIYIYMVSIYIVSANKHPPTQRG